MGSHSPDAPFVGAAEANRRTSAGQHGQCHLPGVAMLSAALGPVQFRGAVTVTVTMTLLLSIALPHPRHVASKGTYPSNERLGDGRR
jgi:hypothetical protein